LRLKKFTWSVLVLSVALGFALLVYGTVCSIQFKQNCKGYLKHAADANTVALAKQELGKAVDYIEAEGLTSGSTHVFYSMPDCDLGFWYQNLRASLDELDAIGSDADQLTVSNQLLKLRESIMDSGEKGTRVTVPPNIHVFPHQLIYRTLGFGCLAGMSISLLMVSVEAEKKSRKKGCCNNPDSGIELS